MRAEDAGLHGLLSVGHKQHQLRRPSDKCQLEDSKAIRDINGDSLLMRPELHPKEEEEMRAVDQDRRGNHPPH